MPTITAGGSLTLASTGTDAPVSGSIDIIASGGGLIAAYTGSPPPAGTTFTLTNGWTFVYDSASPPNFTITAPSGATNQTGCEVRAQCYVAGAGTNTPHSAFFGIGVPPPTSAKRRSRLQVY